MTTADPPWLVDEKCLNSCLMVTGQEMNIVSRSVSWASNQQKLKAKKALLPNHYLRSFYLSTKTMTSFRPTENKSQSRIELSIPSFLFRLTSRSQVSRPGRHVNGIWFNMEPQRLARLVLLAMLIGQQQKCCCCWWWWWFFNKMRVSLVFVSFWKENCKPQLPCTWLCRCHHHGRSIVHQIHKKVHAYLDPYCDPCHDLA